MSLLSNDTRTPELSPQGDLAVLFCCCLLPANEDFFVLFGVSSGTRYKFCKVDKYCTMNLFLEILIMHFKKLKLVFTYWLPSEQEL